jgi:hypothetical protein
MIISLKKSILPDDIWRESFRLYGKDVLFSSKTAINSPADAAAVGTAEKRTTTQESSLDLQRFRPIDQVHVETATQVCHTTRPT